MAEAASNPTEPRASVAAPAPLPAAELLSVLFDNSSEVILLLAPSGRVLRASAAVERLLDWPVSEFAARTLYDVTHPDDHAAIRRSLASRRASRLRFHLRHRDGNWIPFASRWQRTGDTILLNAFDQGTVQRLEDQLIHAQRLATVGRFVSGLVHDLNNTLTVMLGQTEMAGEHLPEGSTAGAHLEHVRDASEHATGLAAQLLAYARRSEISAPAVSPNSVITALQGLLGRMIGEDIQLTVRLDRAVGTVRIDPTQLEQVLANLAINARDAMPDGGELILETTRVQLAEAPARDRTPLPPGDYVCLTVSDTGTGIPPAIRDRIFEPFFTTKDPERGTGLGLATCRTIVERAGGSIRLSPRQGAHGTRFDVLLPRTMGVDPGDARARRGAAAAIPTGTETLLVVEDEAGLRRVARLMLERLGYTVYEACDGKDALRFFANGEPPIDLVVSDVVMPRLGGTALYRQVAELGRRVRFMFVTGHLPREAPDTRHVQVLQKPWTFPGLAAAIRTELDRPLPAGEILAPVAST